MSQCLAGFKCFQIALWLFFLALDTALNYLAFKMRFDRDRLRAFADTAMASNVSYFAVRRELYGLFTAALDRGGVIEVSSQECITIRTFLTSRDPNPSDQARLAYEVALVKIFELTQ